MSLTSITFALPARRVHELSLGVLDYLGDASVEEGIAALALSIGRVMSPKQLSQLEEKEFVQGILEWAGSYIGTIDGGMN